MSKNKTRKLTESSVDKCVRLFLEDRADTKSAETVVKALACAKDEDGAVAAIIAVNKIFSRVFSEDEKFFKDDEHPLAGVFSASWSSLLAILPEGNKASDLALQTLLMWIECETVKKSTETSYGLPETRLEELLRVLCSDSAMEKHLVQFQNKLEAYDDLNFYTCKALWKISDKFSKPTTELEIQNYFTLIKAIRVKDKITKDQTLPTFVGEEIDFPFNFQDLRKFYQYAWVNFLRAALPEKLYIHVLVFLDEKKVALFKNPCLMADFLIESYNKGGSIALLALNGLFTLIHKYNLELPDFYTRLYALFKADIFYQKYRARFFFLADLFLSSSHLPAYLVAAFAKKMARLCLIAPAYSQLHVIPFIGNLVIRHAALSRMVHCQETKDMNSDPFDENETDPAKSRALESSLWELKTLQSHWLQSVAAKSSIINSAFPKIEWDFSDVLEGSYVQLFEKAVKDKYRGSIPTTNYHKPKGLLKHADDKLKSSWILE
ncbi:nucleolar complex protein 4 homolog [Galendromus occidentalis]|uniref:Nucleolar complex protein 4 homolog n=1 Tax=Galendromus occidentalis TaxID=34638 RepID=A0AAJ6VWQ5_9ACAR|nr:nucleolar complex protein 4 homolog [Galendromus occidentalis]